MKPAVADVTGIIVDCLGRLRADLGLAPLEKIDSGTAILGSGSDLDSMAVVHLIVDLEGALQERFELNWILADERALSRKRSPFRSVADLVEFIIETTPED